MLLGIVLAVLLAVAVIWFLAWAYNKPDVRNEPASEGKYRIYFDNKRSWYDPMQAIINELPKLNTSIGRWELYIDNEAGKDYLILNWLDQIETGKVVRISQVDLSNAGFHSSWRSLDGCTKSYQYEEVRRIIVIPVLETVESKFKWDKIKGAIKKEPRSYTII